MTRPSSSMPNRRFTSNTDFPFLHGRDISCLSAAQRLSYENAAFRYWRNQGFPLPSLTHSELVEQYYAFANSSAYVKREACELGWSSLGLAVANSFHPGIWSTKCERFRTPGEVFDDDTMLRDCIRRAVLLWKDRRPVSPRCLRSILSTYKNTKRVANFRPTIARTLYELYSSDGDVILDPAAGYGGRLLGALPLNRQYWGIEPNKAAYNGNKRMIVALARETVADATMMNLCAEDALPQLKSRSVQLVILSPPYFKRERYANDSRQSWRRYSTYDSWISDFLAQILEESRRILCNGGFLILNVANTESHRIGDDATRLAGELFALHRRFDMKIGSVPYHRNGKRGGFRHEPVYIYRKGV